MSHARAVRNYRITPTLLLDYFAVVRKVSRGRRNPPGLNGTVHEWLTYVNTTSDGDLPSATKSTAKKATEKLAHTKQGGGIRKVSFAPKYRYENDSEVIFALPDFSLNLKTEHDLPMTEKIAKSLLKYPSLQKLRWETTMPSSHVVDASFHSRFGDSISVTMDVGLFLFLHDLILAYMREKETTLTSKWQINDIEANIDNLKSF